MTSSIGVVQSHQCMSPIVSPDSLNSARLTKHINISSSELLQRSLQRDHHTLYRVSGSVDLVGVFLDLLVVYVGGIFGRDDNVVSNA